MPELRFDPVALPETVPALRAELRAFLASELGVIPARRRANSWGVFDAAFSKRLGAQGFVGMVWPKRYGGHERSALERYVVLEELLAAGAPVGAHWVADRQSGMALLRYGSEEQRMRWLPGMADGSVYCCIGMSEPNAGSDLASVRTRATQVEGGWRIRGQKIWTSNAHRSHLMIALVRTSGDAERRTDRSQSARFPRSEPTASGERGAEGAIQLAGSEPKASGDPTRTRHEGLSQFLIELALPGIRIRPIRDLTGDAHFDEVFFDDAFVPDSALLGPEGAGWKQVTSELSLERSGPERYLSSFALFVELVRAAGPDPPEPLRGLIGRATAQLWTLREMSLSVAGQLAGGRDPALEAAVVKDLGNEFEQELPRLVQALADADVVLEDDAELCSALSYLLQVAPSFSLRGGTREILRGIIARGLGLR